MKKRTAKSYRVSELLIQKGFPADLAEIIGSELNTDFTASQMLGYLRDAGAQSVDEVIDEMLGILELRKQCIQRQIAKRRKPNMNDLYIRSFSVSWSGSIEPYVRRIAALHGLNSFDFSKRVTFFTGENGSGKSTLLEALAVASGLNPEGGTWFYTFRTYDDCSGLWQAIRLIRGACRPKWSYFLRAESFFNAATAATDEYIGPHNYHEQSHGESFMDFIMDKPLEGLYFLDEPEAALSPQKQLELLLYIYKMAQRGSQFIIATHSPILLGIPDADIVSFDEGGLKHISYEESQSYQVTKLFVNNREAMLRQLLRDDQDVSAD